ncbi:major facilitator superfamily domain-containing protein [Suillus subaureus]|uniref:Major facilitator superfamily domain-containing protein n=1 Tax=Suillus subaureus TaxID=48587 RepID=A0A9P7JEK9_9AGAM|nr:major facilitator superfamily domain-containing protein [Suillus subaureus]KAG1817689.1 major facilitator superfamily domain-containing protein [Suillus subaureus]
MAPGLPELARKYGITNPTVTALTLSIFLLSFAISPLVATPLSEVYGHVIVSLNQFKVLHLANLFFLGSNLGCAFSPNTTSFLVFRFLAGLATSAPVACGGGVISDLFSKCDRAAVGPVMGGFIAESISIQYDFYVITAICGITAVLGIPFMRESYAPVIRLHHEKMATDLEKAPAGYPTLTTHHMGKWAYLWINLKTYGIYYLMFATFPNLFSEVYHFNIGISGLTSIRLGFGFIFVTIFSIKLSSKIYIYLATQNGGKGKPEMHIATLIFGSFFVPVGLFWYSWSAQAKAHFIMPIIGTTIFGFGIMTVFLPVQLYLVDTFTYAASASTAASMFRSLLGFAFPLFGQQMFAALGYGGGNSLLTGLAIIIGIPFPIWIYYAGKLWEDWTQENYSVQGVV